MLKSVQPAKTLQTYYAEVYDQQEDVPADGNCFFWACARQLIHLLCLNESLIASLSDEFMNFLYQKLPAAFKNTRLSELLNNDELNQLRHSNGSDVLYTQLEYYFQSTLRLAVASQLAHFKKESSTFSSDEELASEVGFIRDVLNAALSDSDLQGAVTNIKAKSVIEDFLQDVENEITAPIRKQLILQNDQTIDQRKIKIQNDTNTKLAIAIKCNNAYRERWNAVLNSLNELLSTDRYFVGEDAILLMSMLFPNIAIRSDAHNDEGLQTAKQIWLNKQRCEEIPAEQPVIHLIRLSWAHYNSAGILLKKPLAKMTTWHSTPSVEEVTKQVTSLDLLHRLLGKNPTELSKPFVTDNSTNYNATTTKHDYLIKKDKVTILKMLEHVNALLRLEQNGAESQLDEVISLLSHIGRCAELLSWDELDRECIRNKYGYINRYKHAGAEKRKDGIDFEQLANLPSLFTDPLAKKIKSSLLLQRGYHAILTDILILKLKLQKIIVQEKFNTNAENLPLTDSTREIINIQFFCSYLNDIRCLEKVITELRSLDEEVFDLTNSRIDRYYFARIITILGETIKNISSFLRENHDLNSLFTAIGHLRDYVKIKPALAVEANSGLTQLYDFLKLNIASLRLIFSTLTSHLTFATADKLTSWEKLINDCYRLPSSILALKTEIQKLDQLARAAKKHGHTKQTQESTTKQNSQPKSVQPISADNKIISLLKSIVKFSQEIVDAQASTAALSSKKEAEKKKKDEKSKQNLEKMKSQYRKLIDALPEENRTQYPDINNSGMVSNFLISKEKIDTELPPSSAFTPSDKDIQEKSEEEVYKYLEKIRNETKFLKILNELESTKKVKYAIALAIGFIGQYNKILFEDHNASRISQIVYQDWQFSMQTTLRVRNKVIMHCILEEDHELIAKTSKEDVVPWLNDVQASLAIFKLKPLLDNPEWMQVVAAQKFDNNLIQARCHLANHLGLAYTRLGKLEDAIIYFKFAISGLPDGYSKTAVMHNLADIYRLQDNWPIILQLMQDILSIRRRTLGDDAEEVAESWNDLGVAYSHIGDNQRAEHAFIMALLIKRTKVNITTFCNLANIYADEKKYTKAITYYARAFSKATEEKNVLTIFHILISLSRTYHEINKFDDALSHLLQAEKIFSDNPALFRKKFGDRYSFYKINLLHDFAHLHYNMGHYGEAVIACETQLELLQAQQIKNDFSLIPPLLMLGILYINVNRVEDAIIKLQLAYGLSIKRPELRHDQIASIKNSLGLAYFHKKQYVEARVLCQQSADTLRKYGQKHNTLTYHHLLAQTLNTLGGIHVKMGDIEKGLKDLTSALEINLTIYADYRPNIEIVKNYSQLGAAYLTKKEPENAKKYFQLALEEMDKLFPDGSHPDHPRLKTNLAIVLFELEQLDNAKVYFEAALTTFLQDKISAENYDWGLHDCYHYLAAIAIIQEDVNSALNYYEHWFPLAVKLHNSKLPSEASVDLYFYSRLHYVRGEFKEAKRKLKLAIQCYNDDDLSIIARLHIKLGKIYQTLGQVLMGKGKFLLSRKKYQKALESYIVAIAKLKQINGVDLNAKIKKYEDQAITCTFYAETYSSSSTAGIAFILEKKRNYENIILQRIKNQYQAYVKTRGVPPEGSALRIKFSIQDTSVVILQRFMQDWLQVKAPCLEEKNDILFATISVADINRLTR